ncbi:hypothetical protein EG329_004776 [Mollisiaceae sp. DMI_Dod_QoI]|nr:hypothetical protein EG329_004776 [Helotiales sp. DMI_Dod_QoI]
MAEARETEKQVLTILPPNTSNLESVHPRTIQSQGGYQRQQQPHLADIPTNLPSNKQAQDERHNQSDTADPQANLPANIQSQEESQQASQPSPLPDHLAQNVQPGEDHQQQSQSVPADPLINSVIDGRFQVVALLKETGVDERAIYIALDKKLYAVKILQKEPLRTYNGLVKEGEYHSMVHNHPNIVTVHKVAMCGERHCLVMDYYPEGDLQEHILRKCDSGNKINVKKIFLQILNAVEYCHNRGIYHMDLKLENILIRRGTIVALTDFGWATRKEFAQHCRGTLGYQSPGEQRLFQISSKPPTESRPLLENSGADAMRPRPYRCSAQDIWSLGIILIRLTCIRFPWNEATEDDLNYKRYREGARLHTFLSLSEAVSDILDWVFGLKEDDRPSIKQLKAVIQNCHNFVSEPRSGDCSSIGQT